MQDRIKDKSNLAKKAREITYQCSLIGRLTDLNVTCLPSIILQGPGEWFMV